ncbi:MAG: hypothetical protein FD119_860 [Stygiobacter sp.]|nr:MAG: hypothetical protein FD119_860 [Stygiobacter sp.]
MDDDKDPKGNRPGATDARKGTDSKGKAAFQDGMAAATATEQPAPPPWREYASSDLPAAPETPPATPPVASTQPQVPMAAPPPACDPTDLEGEVPSHPVTITLSGLRANSKMTLNIREDQRAIWCKGPGQGMVGMSISTTKDPVLYLSSFLVNAREMYLQTNAACQEIQIQIYVRTFQHDLRGHISLPPDASATLETRVDRTSLIGLSSFAIEF